MRVAVGAVTQTGLPFCVPSLLPKPSPTTASVVKPSEGKSVKPQSYTWLDAAAATTESAKNFCPAELLNFAPEFIGMVNCDTPLLPATVTELLPARVVTLMVMFVGWGL